jgi:hypothetical protein
MQKHQPLNEGLRSKDLKDLVSNLFTVDQYSSKMGEDKDIVVLGFHVTEKNPAADLMEFMERGYKFILDADMSTGEENDGKYQVFVEIERTEDLPVNLENLLRGVGQLTDIKDWRFRYQKQPSSIEFNEDTVMKNIPLTPTEYESKILEIKNTDIKEFFDQGSTEVELDEDNNLTFTKPYSGDVTAKFIAIGDYEDVKHTVQGGISLDESSQSQTTFLNKYLGNYDINKIGNKFLIRNGKKAVVVEKGQW